MNLDEKSDNNMKSPCISNCCLDENDICLGCFRTLSEITQWTLVDAGMRQFFLQNSLERKKAYENQ